MVSSIKGKCWEIKVYLAKRESSAWWACIPKDNRTSCYAQLQHAISYASARFQVLKKEGKNKLFFATKAQGFQNACKSWLEPARTQTPCRRAHRLTIYAIHNLAGFQPIILIEPHPDIADIIKIDAGQNETQYSNLHWNAVIIKAHGSYSLYLFIHFNLD